MVWKHTVAWGGWEEEQGAAVGAKETVSSFSVTVGIGTPPIGRGCVQGEMEVGGAVQSVSVKSASPSPMEH